MELIEPYKDWIYIAAGVLALLIIAWLVTRRVSGSVRAKRGARLGIVEYHEVDKSRFLVLVRRDDVEHLVLIGGGQDVVIETGIGARAAARTMRGAGSQPPAPPGPHAEPELGGGARPPGTRPAPRPAVFGDDVPAQRPPTGRRQE
jgi:hypothetical protein